MSDWRITQRSSTYLDVLRATESIEEPAVGFAKPSEAKTTTTSTLIKQNNTIIQLLIKISENLEDCKEKLKALKAEKQKAVEVPNSIEASIENLSQNLTKLSLGEQIPKKTPKKGPFFVFKNPKEILEAEKKSNKP